MGSLFEKPFLKLAVSLRWKKSFHSWYLVQSEDILLEGCQSKFESKFELSLLRYKQYYQWLLETLSTFFKTLENHVKENSDQVFSAEVSSENVLTNVACFELWDTAGTLES